jgi:hypothetical protein
MILPNKTIRPVDSLLYISSYVIKVLENKELAVDEVYEKVKILYPKKISIETLLLCLNYLYVIGKLEHQNETVKIKF